MYLAKKVEFFEKDGVSKEGYALYRFWKGSRIDKPIFCPFCREKVFPPVTIGNTFTEIKVFDFETVEPDTVLVIRCFRGREHSAHFSSASREEV